MTENDRGWYNCKVRFLNRSPAPSGGQGGGSGGGGGKGGSGANGTWYHLDVHAKPRFVEKEKMHPIVYASVGESIILRCHVSQDNISRIYSVRATY